MNVLLHWSSNSGSIYLFSDNTLHRSVVIHGRAVGLVFTPLNLSDPRSVCGTEPAPVEKQDKGQFNSRLNWKQEWTPCLRDTRSLLSVSDQCVGKDRSNQISTLLFLFLSLHPLLFFSANHLQNKECPKNRIKTLVNWRWQKQQNKNQNKKQIGHIRGYY